MSKNKFRNRRLSAISTFAFILIIAFTFTHFSENNSVDNPAIINNQISQTNENTDQPLAIDVLNKLPVKGRAPKTDYSRNKFGGEWESYGKTCNQREKILARDLIEIVFDDDKCTVKSGVLVDPYTGKNINFTRGSKTSSAVQIDHVVAVSNAWQTGAQQISQSKREEFYNDSLNLLAVDGPANNQKSDSDAATWLPPNKLFRCEYVARQIAVKKKYLLWLTQAEHDSIEQVLSSCPNERLPQP